MSEVIFKPVADVFALIHAGGAPYQWTTSAEAAVEWLKENPKYSVREYVTLERYQLAASEDAAALREKLDAAEQKISNLNEGWLNCIAERDEARTKLDAMAAENAAELSSGVREMKDEYTLR